MMVRQMKASGVSWIGDIPVSWSTVRVKDLADENCQQLTQIPDEIRYIDIGSVSATEGIRNVQLLKKENIPSRARRLPKKGDLLVSNVRTYLRAMALIKEDGFVASTGFSVFTPHNDINASFMFYALQSESFMVGVDAASKGISYPAISGSALRNLNVVRPMLAEQIAIASYLDDRTTAIDRKIQLLEEKSKGLAELRKSVVHQAVTKGLNPNVAMKSSGVDWIGDVPAHWSLTRADRLFMKMKKTQQEKNVLSLSYGQIINKKIGNEGLTPENYDSYQGVSPNDIILRLTDLQNDERSIRVAHSSLTGIITSAYLVLKTKNNLLSLFGYLLLHTAGDINKLFYSMGGGVRQTMKFNDIARLSFAVPSIEEQTAIIKYINDRTTIIDESIKTIADQIAAMKSLRQSLIHEAVTGKIDVADYGYHYA